MQGYSWKVPFKINLPPAIFKFFTDLKEDFQKWHQLHSGWCTTNYPRPKGLNSTPSECCYKSLINQNDQNVPSGRLGFVSNSNSLWYKASLTPCVPTVHVESQTPCFSSLPRTNRLHHGNYFLTTLHNKKKCQT